MTITRKASRTGIYTGETFADDDGVVLATITPSRLRGDGHGVFLRTYTGPDEADIARYGSLAAARQAAFAHARLFEA